MILIETDTGGILAVFLGLKPPVASGLTAVPDGSGEGAEDTQGSPLLSPGSAPSQDGHLSVSRAYLTQLQWALQFSFLSPMDVVICVLLSWFSAVHDQPIALLTPPTLLLHFG